MNKLEVSYGSLKLKNPIIVGACNLVTNPEHLKKVEKAGAAAIVYKSLFEEQIALEELELEHIHASHSFFEPEHESSFPVARHAGPAAHLQNLKEAKELLTIPVIGSLNCFNSDSWVEYATKMEKTGIDGLELNFYPHFIDSSIDAAQLEKQQIDILKAVCSAVNIPVFVKLSPYYTNTLHYISQLEQCHVSGYSLFNRLFQPSIDIEEMKHVFPFNFSHEEDYRLALRYAGLLYGQVKGSLIATNGVQSGKDIAKLILAGANAVQVVSVLYKKGIGHISTMLHDLEQWMEKHNISSLQEVCGTLSKEKVLDTYAYKRAQYVDLLMRSELFLTYNLEEE